MPYTDYYQAKNKIKNFGLFCIKDSTWAPYEQTKTVLQTCSFLKDIRLQISKTSTPRSVSQRGVEIFFSKPFKNLTKTVGQVEIVHKYVKQKLIFST